MSDFEFDFSNFSLLYPDADTMAAHHAGTDAPRIDDFTLEELGLPEVLPLKNSRLSDFVIITSDNSRGESPEQIFSDIQKGIDKEKPHILIRDRREAIRYAVSTARAGDVILLAGKGHETYEIGPMGVRHFDEREIVRQALEKRKNGDTENEN